MVKSPRVVTVFAPLEIITSDLKFAIHHVSLHSEQDRTQDQDGAHCDRHAGDPGGAIHQTLAILSALVKNGNIGLPADGAHQFGDRILDELPGVGSDLLWNGTAIGPVRLDR
jgi:hypothetical protein